MYEMPQTDSSRRRPVLRHAACLARLCFSCTGYRADVRAQDINAIRTVSLVGSMAGDAQWWHEIDIGGGRWLLEMRASSLLWHGAATTSDRLFHVGELLIALLAVFTILSAASHSAGREVRLPT